MKTKRILSSVLAFCWLLLPLAACGPGGGGDKKPPVTSAAPAAGTYVDSVEVSLTCTDGDGSGCFTTFYTLDGSDPDQSSTPYAGPITIQTTTELRFFSVDNAGNEESPRSAAYTIEEAADEQAPVTSASPAGGTFFNTVEVRLACDDGAGSGCAATYYTTDGSDPDDQSQVYESRIPIAANTVLKFFSVDQAGNEEPVRTETYVIEIEEQDTTPPLTSAAPVGGSYEDAQTVSLTCDDGQGSGCFATYYTRDGSEPTTGSNVYSQPILIDADTTLKFFSVDNEDNAEVVRTEVYQIVGACTPGVDTDGDGLEDCDELAGWYMNLDLNGDGDTEDMGEHEVFVASDPFQADADEDGLEDLEELQRKLNPNRADTDQDGLTDFEELRIYFCDADHVDSDGDATGPDHDQLPDSGLFDGAEVNTHHTSPQMDDTDGDTFTDLEEVQSSTNPLVADLPRIQVGVATSVDVTLHADLSQGCQLEEETFAAHLSRDASRSVARSSSAFEHTTSISNELHSEMNTSVGGIFPSFSGGVTNDLSLSSTTSLETNLSFEAESTRTVSDEYRQHKRENCFSSSDIHGGSISATIRVSNVGDAAVYLEDMEVIALKRDRQGAGVLTTLASVELFDDSTSVGGSPKDVAVSIDITADQAMQLLDDPSGLFVYASRYSMTNEDGRDYAFIESETLNRTGMLEIDFGNGRLERYLIATNVARNDANEPLGINLAWAFENVLGWVRGVDYDTVANGDGLSVLSFVDDEVQYGTDLDAYQGWLVMGNGQAFEDPESLAFEDVVLHRGETISLSFVRDSDRDGLFDKEEAFYGSDPLVADTDADMISDKDEADSPTRHPVVPEFPAGQRVAQVATVAPTNDPIQTLALLANGTLWRLDGIPLAIDTPVRFESISGGFYRIDGQNHVTWAGISTDGDLYTWGSNVFGKLGSGDSGLLDQQEPTLVGSACNCWAQVDVGDSHVLALRTDGSLWSWGYNGSGQLGSAASQGCPGEPDENLCRRSPAQADAGPWLEVSAGRKHSLGIKDDNSLWAWGENSAYQLGTGDRDDRQVPTRIHDYFFDQYGNDTWLKVEAEGSTSLAALDLGPREQVQAWGAQYYSRYAVYTGDSYDFLTYFPSSRPFPYVTCSSDADCGFNQMCYYTGSGRQCWYAYGALHQPYPFHMFGEDGSAEAPTGHIVSLSAEPRGAATWGHVVSNGRTYTWETDASYTWGINPHGETGQGPGGEDVCIPNIACNRDPRPVADSQDRPFLAIERGRAISDPSNVGSPTTPPPVKGALSVWGDNGDGELGLGPGAGADVYDPALVPEYPLP